MKINVIGWYDKKNCGDESFKFVFREIFSDHEVIFSTQKIIDNCDTYILGGGDVLKSYYLDNIPNDLKINCIGVGLGYESEMELLSKKNISNIYTRNKIDVEPIRKKVQNTFYTPDIVFNLKKPTEIKQNLTTGKKKLSVILTDHVNPSVVNKNVKELMYNEYFKWELAETLDYLVQFYQIYFVSLSNNFYAYDKKMCIDVQSRMQHGYKTEIFEESEDPNRLMDFLQQMDLNVSMKFHGLIFSTICNIPFINIGISRKTNKFCEEMCLSELSLDPKTFTQERFLEKLKFIESNTLQIKSKLDEVDKSNKKILNENILVWRKIINNTN